MPAYRIKHLPTGLYYIPSRRVAATSPDSRRTSYVKSNLSRMGKAYARRPSLNQIGNTYYSHLNARWELQGGYWYVHSMLSPTIASEWTIEEMQ